MRDISRLCCSDLLPFEDQLTCSLPVALHGWHNSRRVKMPDPIRIEESPVLRIGARLLCVHNRIEH